jgi:hypothetical protein
LILTFGRGDVSRFGTAFETVVAVCNVDYHRVIVSVNGKIYIATGEASGGRVFE